MSPRSAKVAPASNTGPAPEVMRAPNTPAEFFRSRIISALGMKPSSDGAFSVDTKNQAVAGLPENLHRHVLELVTVIDSLDLADGEDAERIRGIKIRLIQQALGALESWNTTRAWVEAVKDMTDDKGRKLPEDLIQRKATRTETVLADALLKLRAPETYSQPAPSQATKPRVFTPQLRSTDLPDIRGIQSVRFTGTAKRIPPKLLDIGPRGYSHGQSLWRRVEDTSQQARGRFTSDLSIEELGHIVGESGIKSERVLVLCREALALLVSSETGNLVVPDVRCIVDSEREGERDITYLLLASISNALAKRHVGTVHPRMLRNTRLQCTTGTEKPLTVAACQITPELIEGVSRLEQSFLRHVLLSHVGDFGAAPRTFANGSRDNGVSQRVSGCNVKLREQESGLQFKGIFGTDGRTVRKYGLLLTDEDMFRAFAQGKKRGPIAGAIRHLTTNEIVKGVKQKTN